MQIQFCYITFVYHKDEISTAIDDKGGNGLRQTTEANLTKVLLYSKNKYFDKRFCRRLEVCRFTVHVRLAPSPV